MLDLPLSLASRAQPAGQPILELEISPPFHYEASIYFEPYLILLTQCSGHKRTSHLTGCVPMDNTRWLIQESLDGLRGWNNSCPAHVEDDFRIPSISNRPGTPSSGAFSLSLLLAVMDCTAKWPSYSQPFLLLNFKQARPLSLCLRRQSWRVLVV